MPKHRPMQELRHLGARMRARRLHLGRSREIVAQAAEISVTQLVLYESGQGHPPAFTLHRLAMTLGTTTSALLGETMNENADQVAEMMKIYAHPQIGMVLRYMQDMSKEDRNSLQIVYLVDVENAISVDVEATTAIRQAEVLAAKRMIERSMERFDFYPARLMGDSAYGSAELLGWLVYEHGIDTSYSTGLIT
jgi:transcriptional regulator with XRE-family HTH domain